MNKWMIIPFLFSLSAWADARSECDTAQGICLDGKRSSFQPNTADFSLQRCRGYPDPGIACQIENDLREFSWNIIPVKAYDPVSGNFSASSLYVTNRFPILGAEDLPYFAAYADSYTLNLSYDIAYAGYFPFQRDALGYAARTEIRLICDGKVWGNPIKAQYRDGTYDGGKTFPLTVSAVIADFPSDACASELAVELFFEGKILRVKKLSLALLRET